MKKFIYLIFVFFISISNFCQAQITEKPTEITFIYINGSNNLSYNNRLKFKTNFIRDVKKMHPEIKKRFEKDELINEKFLQNGKYIINNEPITFYWGDRSLNIVERLDRDLNSAKKYSPKIAHQARSLFAHCLHDAVWVQKTPNMTSVLNDLHKIINNELQKGNKVVLLGYSAGSFVTYQYYMNKASFINFPEIALERFNTTTYNYIVNNPIKPTCFDALIKADLIKYNSETNTYITNSDIETFKKNYKNLPIITESICFNEGDIKGTIGFASPTRLFYSDLMNANTSTYKLSELMGKSIIENEVFYLTVNYNNDPFGFSNAENFTLKSLKTNNYNLFKNLKKEGGFIYNKSNNYVPRTFITAHLAYWNTPKRFAKAIVKTFNEGYKNFYGI